MKTHRVLLLLALAAMLAFVVACDEDTTGNDTEFAEPTTDDMDDTAEDFAATLADPETGIITYWESEGLSDGGFASMKEGTVPQVADTSFERGGITITIDRTFYDIEDNPSEVYDSSSTVRMTRLLTMEGERTGARRSATIDHESFIDVTGMASDDTVRTINGNGSREVSSTFQARWRPVQRTFEAVHTWQEHDIERHVDRRANPYPLSGSITGATDIVRSAERGNRTRTVEVNVEFTVTFDGSRYAMVEIVDGPTYWVDLDTGLAYRERPDEG
ncbi:hypothetical protein GF324_06760 [bacterium]|nr:hypothetical protein [bacterium]